MKHAFMIIAHDNWKQLSYLLSQIDDYKNDIYIHIDKKVKNAPIEEIKSFVKKSKIEIFQEYKVYWGSYELVLTELFLLKKATKINYDYYHLLSGMDMLIKPMRDFYMFFEENNGKEFVNYDTNQRLEEDKEIMRRVKLYHFFVNNRKKYKLKFLNCFFTLVSRTILGVEELLRINRLKNEKFKIKYGSQWFSITDSCARYLLNSEIKISQLFKRTKCADELFVQTIIYNSIFEKNLYNREYNDSLESNMRLIDLKKRGKNGSPYTWQKKDFDEIKESRCLIARKFNCNSDFEIVKLVSDYTNRKESKE